MICQRRISGNPIILCRISYYHLGVNCHLNNWIPLNCIGKMYFRSATVMLISDSSGNTLAFLKKERTQHAKSVTHWLFKEGENTACQKCIKQLSIQVMFSPYQNLAIAMCVMHVTLCTELGLHNLHSEWWEVWNHPLVCIQIFHCTGILCSM